MPQIVSEISHKSSSGLLNDAILHKFKKVTAGTAFVCQGIDEGKPVGLIPINAAALTYVRVD
jgi:hypothetical protein